MFPTKQMPFGRGVIMQSSNNSIEELQTQVDELKQKNVSKKLALHFPVFEGGKIVKDHPDNLRYLLTNILNYNISYNELTQSIEINGQKIDDTNLSRIRNECRIQKLSSNKDFVTDGISELAQANKYHPFKSEVERVHWDNKDHIENLFNTLQINPEFDGNKELYKKYLRKWLIGIIAKVYNPGSQNMMLVLKGGQGIGKSRWASRFGLVKNSYGEGQIDPDNKDHELRHLNKIIWHVSELDAVTRKKDVSALKDYLTRETVSLRKAYGHYETEGRSILSFIGSVNSDQFLTDPTGNRRYLVIPVQSIDMDSPVDMQQVFAQALELYKSGEQYWFNKDEIIEVNNDNEESTIESHLDLIVTRVKSGTTLKTIPQILVEHGYKKHASDILHNEITKFGKLLTEAGIEKKRASYNGKKITQWLVEPYSTVQELL